MSEAASAPSDAGVLRAGGTLSLPELTPAARTWRWIEMALLFLVAPLAVDYAVHTERVPVFIALLPVLLLVAIFLLLDRTFSFRRELSRGFSIGQLVSILAVFALGCSLVAAYVHEYLPGQFLELPRNRPEVWERIMLLYPLMSVLAQELLYRTFYFHRYGVLFRHVWWAAILINGVLFGIGHIVIGTPLAIYGTMAAGVLFAWRYAMTRSFWAVFIEHTLWGWLVFTIGLGRYFFTGVGILTWR
ncbi:CPBP family intramembrane metalloprotease [Hyphomicrobium sp. D-2]|uniref:CPBP family intramembrane glutamic endopeptidase n=1 Tax=Hyphomicrobium sp. D-2 TaxID=3041621 RepID=UPI00245893FB|nr:CPBP family intramembrane metalloprotease [Hyphomicrobium sp. D-2]MDH4981748.1 CPBP family intramembrane metalloprotease [Hyphomicrobium sp. D-2]